MNISDEKTKDSTMIFAIPSNAQASSFDRRETKPDGLAQSGGIDMRNAVLVADPTIRKIESLPRNVPVRVWCIVGGEPTEE